MKHSAAEPPRQGLQTGVGAGIRGALLTLGLIAALIGAQPSRAAPQVVTVCGRDDAPGGLNLATAMAAGGDIVIRCLAGPSVITLTSTLAARGIVHVDGEGKAVLRGPVAGPLFTADVALRLSRLTVENPRSAATAGAPGAGTVIFGPKATVELDTVTTQNSRAAYVAQRLSARDSVFLRNGDAAGRATAAVIDADAVDLLRTTFTDNLDHPVAGGSSPIAGRIALSREVRIDDSTFTGNRATLLLADARVSVRRSRFQGNGTPADTWGGAWDCCGGAVTFVRADADVADSEFRGNASAGFGGAIYAIGSRLRVARSLFEGNKARVGGAVMVWGRRPLQNIWSSEDWLEPPRLELRRVRFRANTSTAAGGALAFAGTVDGDAVLFEANVSGGAGGAVAGWQAVELAAPHDGVFDGLVATTSPAAPDRLLLSRPIMVGNVAGGPGAALAAGPAAVVIGNGLLTGNRGTATGGTSGGTLSGTQLTVVNATLADNPAGGISGGTGAAVRLGNAILLRNAAYNCAVSGTLSDAGGNLQHPGIDCGVAAASQDAGLDSRYAPELLSAARGAGQVALCAADPQVRGVDVFGNPRLARGRCDVGAIEVPFPESMASALGVPRGQQAVARLVWLLVLLALLLFLLALGWAWWRRRRHRHHRRKPA